MGVIRSSNNHDLSELQDINAMKNPPTLSELLEILAWEKAEQQASERQAASGSHDEAVQPAADNAEASPAAEAEALAPEKTPAIID